MKDLSLIGKEAIGKSLEERLEFFKEEEQKIYYGFFANLDSPHTIKAYMSDLKQFRRFLDKTYRGVSFTKVTYDHIVQYKDYLKACGGRNKGKASDVGLNRKLACLYRFFRYLCQVKIIEENPALYVDRVRVKKEVKTLDLTDEEVKRILEAVDINKKCGYLHHAMLSVLFSTGMRHSELLNLKIGDLKKVDSDFFLEFVGKRKIKRIVGLPDFCMKSLLRYLNDRQASGHEYKLGNDFLFVSSRNDENNYNKDQAQGKSMGICSFGKVFRRYCLKAGIEKNITVHSARSTVIGLLLGKGYGIYDVAKFVGHNDVNSTKAYDKRKESWDKNLGFKIDF